VTPAQRRVLVARDGGCRFPGCDRTPKWTQAHHVKFWSHGGPTELGNLVLLCSFHHHRVHDHNWTLQFDGQTVAVYRPDGTRLHEPATRSPWVDSD
jgi:predicted restriction endonuclease